MFKLDNIFYYALIFAAFLFAVNQITVQSPEMKSASAPASEFSGERAFNILSHLLKENKPHPVGSELNKIVKQRIIDELDKLEIESSVQQTWACSRNAWQCGFVENIIATIPGKSDTDYVTLMSHYDSVPSAPGAGDDAAAVAAMLETARVLKAEAPFDKPIMLLFTDAEEIGLVGAEAFFNQHELASKVGIVLNYEGSGTSGISQVLRTSGANSLFIDAYQRESSHPRGASLINEIFKRMPNDTDFSVVMRADIPGIDIAFASERNHYHTPNDNLENLDKNTLQHHGENMLPTTRWLADNDFTSDEPNLVYAHVYSAWIQWSTDTSSYLIALSFILLVVAFSRKGETTIGVLAGFGSSLVIVITSVLVSFCIFWLINLINGTTVNWPAHDLPYRMALFSSGILGGLLAAIISNRYLNVNNSLLGAWLLWLVLTIVLYIYMPDATNLLLLPLVIGSLILVAASYFSDLVYRYILLLSLIFVVSATLGIVLPLETTQSYRLIFITMPFIALFMTIFVPLIHGAKLKIPLAAMASITALSAIAAIASPLYSEHRPQHVNILYFEHLDEGNGYYWLQHRNPLPDNMLSVVAWNKEKKSLLPYSTYEHQNWLEVESSGFQTPEFKVTSDTKHERGRTVDLVLTSPRNANVLQLVLPGSAKLMSFKLGELSYEPQFFSAKKPENSYYAIRIIGSFSREVPLTLELESQDPFDAYLIDRSSNLPESANKLLAERTRLLSPQNRGDQAILIKSISI